MNIPAILFKTDVKPKTIIFIFNLIDKKKCTCSVHYKYTKKSYIIDT